MTIPANSHIVPPGGQGDARPIARGRAAVANTKIISFVDAEVSRVIEETALEIENVRGKAANDLRFVTHNLRHDINNLAAAINQLRQDVDKLSLQVMFNEFHDLSNQVSALRRDVEVMKQGGGIPKLSG